MNRFFEDMFERPLNALFSSAELLTRRIGGTQLIDGIVSRMVHTLSSSYKSCDTQSPGQSRLGSGQDCGGAAVDPRERSSLE